MNFGFSFYFDSVWNLTLFARENKHDAIKTRFAIKLIKIYLNAMNVAILEVNINFRKQYFSALPFLFAPLIIITERRGVNLIPVKI